MISHGVFIPTSSESGWQRPPKLPLVVLKTINLNVRIYNSKDAFGKYLVVLKKNQKLIGATFLNIKLKLLSLKGRLCQVQYRHKTKELPVRLRDASIFDKAHRVITLCTVSFYMVTSSLNPISTMSNHSWAGMHDRTAFKSTASHLNIFHFLKIINHLSFNVHLSSYCTLTMTTTQRIALRLRNAPN